MSEKSPFAKKLETYDEDQAQAWYDDILDNKEGASLQGEAGRRQLEEADAYYKHMEQLSNDDRSSYDRGLDRREAGEIEDNHDPLIDEAYTENEAHEARRKAADEALEAKFASNPKLRQMDRISEVLFQLRDTEDESAISRRADLEDRLEELLERYAESDDYDPALVEALRDRSNMKAVDEAAANALNKAQEVSAPVVGKKDVVAFDPAAKKAQEAAERDAAEVEAYKIKEVEDDKAAVTPEEREDAHGEAIEEARGRMTEWDRDLEKYTAEVDAIEEAKRRVTIDEYDQAEREAYDEDAARTQAIEDEELARWNAERSRLSKLMERPAGAVTRFADRFANLGRGREKGGDGKRSKRRLALGIGIAAGGAIAMSYFLIKSNHHPHSRSVVTPIPDSGSGDPNAAIRGDYAPKLAGSKGTGGLDQLPLSHDALEASKGEGWLSQLEQMGATPKEAQQLLPHILNSKDPEVQQWVYQMNDGSPGISHPGKFPASMLKSLQELRNR